MWKSTWILLTAAVCGAELEIGKTPHPRLWFPQTAEVAIRQRLARDPLAAKLNEISLQEAERVLKAPVCRHEIPDGKRLLQQSRMALHRVMHSAWAWRMTGEEKFRLRTIAELDAACAFKDWNPPHFLDTAEMAVAVATGYDWIYQTLTPEQQTRYSRAIIDKALKPAAEGYQKKAWWTQPQNNWAQVCGGGIALAAAAVAELEPQMAETFMADGGELIKQCGMFYSPDGMYPEGPGYWHYGTNYHVMFLAASGTLGHPVFDDPVMEMAGNSIMHLTSPIRLNFNFADANAIRETPTPAQCWLAAHYKNEAQAQHVRSLFSRAIEEDGTRMMIDRCFPLSILWLPAAARSSAPPLSAFFRGQQPVATFRTGWDAKDSHLAVKGGTPAASHGQMDVGSFVFDAHGSRWIHDLGSDDYNLPGYFDFGRQRWNYYRLQNRSHNTLEIAGKLQNPKSKPCPIVTPSRNGSLHEASFDLTDAYQESAGKIIRRVVFDVRSGKAAIEDEITQPAGVILWRALTDASAEVRDDLVILKKNDQKITLRDANRSGKWKLESVAPPNQREKQNQGFTAVVLEIPEADLVKVRVEIHP